MKPQKENEVEHFGEKAERNLVKWKKWWEWERYVGGKRWSEREEMKLLFNQWGAIWRRAEVPTVIRYTRTRTACTRTKAGDWVSGPARCHKPGGEWRERSACYRERERGNRAERLSADTHSCGRTAERHHVSFCLPALRTQIELLGDPALSFAHERTITGKLDRNTFNFLTKKMRLKIFA